MTLVLESTIPGYNLFLYNFASQGSLADVEFPKLAELEQLTCLSVGLNLRKKEINTDLDTRVF